MKRALPIDLTPDSIVAATFYLAAAPVRLDALCAGHTEQELRQPGDPTKRSVAEIIAHMLHCEARSAESITLALLANEPLVANIHPERNYGRRYGYDRLPTADLLAYFRIRRSILLNVLTDLSPDQWARTIREEDKQRHESVYLLTRTIVLHELDHLGEIERLLPT